MTRTCAASCDTNVARLSLRRFAFKVRFDYLTADQRWKMLGQELARLGGDATQAALRPSTALPLPLREWQTNLRQQNTFDVHCRNLYHFIDRYPYGFARYRKLRTSRRASCAPLQRREGPVNIPTLAKMRLRHEESDMIVVQLPEPCRRERH